VTATSLNLVLLAAVVSAWALGAYLQWRNIRHQERFLANLERMNLRVSGRVAREKAPRHESPGPVDERIKLAS